MSHRASFVLFALLSSCGSDLCDDSSFTINDNYCFFNVEDDEIQKARAQITIDTTRDIFLSKIKESKRDLFLSDEDSFNVKIIYLEEDKLEKHCATPGGCAGVTRTESFKVLYLEMKRSDIRIRISKPTSAKSYFNALSHEVIHAFAFIANIKKVYDHNNDIKEGHPSHLFCFDDYYASCSQFPDSVEAIATDLIKSQFTENNLF